MANRALPTDTHISAISPGSLSWDLEAVRAATTKRPRKPFQSEAMAWQNVSQRGDWAALRSIIDQSKKTRGRRKNPDRVVEIHAIAGAIGEQLTLSWASEQDAQRILQATKLGNEHQRLILRAVSESAAYFLIGAAHGLGNLVVRVALLDSSAEADIRHQCRTADFSVGSDDRRAWLQLSKASEVLEHAASVSSNAHLTRCASSIKDLHDDVRFKNLEDRRGMDFHRLRDVSP